MVGGDDILGTFVRLDGDIGKVVSVEGHEAIVEFFDAPVPGGSTQVPAPLNPPLTRVTLKPQTRIWWNDAGTWRIGRISEPPVPEAPTYLIELFNKKNVELSPADFYVRWSKPLTDPVRLLAARTVDAPFIYRARKAFVGEMLRHRGAAELLTGITSSGVRLHRHQVTAARRILRDPVRRYLLADEVGLGKTIEAGMVLRQSMLDEEGFRGLVLVPSQLVEQWEVELESKFDLQGLRRGYVDVRPYDWLLNRSGSQHRDYSMVVVDEAHRIADDGADPVLYDAIAKVALAAHGLLLLTATPVRSNEAAFLRLLHLLDPENYAMDQVDEFRERVRLRDEIGDCVRLLGDDMAVVWFEEPIDRLRIAFPDDGHLHELLAPLEAAVQSEDESDARTRAREVRQYVSDTYRIHRRMIRTRRGPQLYEEFPVRQRAKSAKFEITDHDPRRRAIVELLDRFRAELLDEPESARLDSLRLVGSRCNAATPALAALGAALQGHQFDDLLDWERPIVEALRSRPLGKNLSEWIGAAIDSDANDVRVDAALAWAWGGVNKKKLAACSSYTSVATSVVARMRDAYGPHRVAGLLSTMSAEELIDEFQRASTDPECVLLVCDRIAEEGWNLQFIDEVLHLDVPWSANQLEQRLGRFDRFTDKARRDRPVLSTVVVDTPSLAALSGAWVRLLDSGFDVFQTSCATLQYALPEHEERALETILAAGFTALDALAASEHDELSRVRRELAGQDLLDSIETSDDDNRFFEHLVAVDRDSKKLGDASSNWIGKAFRCNERFDDGIYRFTASKKNPPMLTEDQVAQLALRDVPYSTKRRLVGDGIRPLRPGMPLLDAAFDLCFSDDRGLAFAAVHERRDLTPGLVVPFFVFNFLVGTATHGNESSGPNKEILHGLAQHFPARMETVWYSIGRGEPPADLQTTFNAFSPGVFVNLCENSTMFDELTQYQDWIGTCRRAEAEARAVAISRQSVTTSIGNGLASLEADRVHTVARDMARARSVGESFDLERINGYYEQVKASIVNPAVTTDSCGVVFLVGPSE